jgi:hypothetical protein
VLDDIGKSLYLTLGTVDSFVVNIVSSAGNTDEAWPFVTVPDFAVRAAKVLSLSDAIFLTVYPLVSGDQRSNWENYTSENKQWVSLARGR